MNRSLLALAFAVAPYVAAHSVQAQAHPLVGEWNVSLAVGMRIENGEQTIISQKGSMVVAVVGDSLVATLTMQPLEGRPARPPSRMAAKMSSGKVVFVRTSEANVNMGGEDQKVTATSTFSFEPAGDVLGGSVSSEIPGMAGMGAQPITGNRVKR